MLYAAHAAILNAPDDKGFTHRTHLVGLVRRGVAKPADRDMLDGPAFPEALADLWEQFQVLDRMRDVGEHGPKRFTPSHIKDAADLFDWSLAPHEVDAFVELDAVTCSPAAARAYYDAVS